jgi:hypothetical protein
MRKALVAGTVGVSLLAGFELKVANEVERIDLADIDMLAVWMLCQNLIVQYSCQSRLKDQPVQHPFCPSSRLAVSRSSFPAGVGSLPKAGLMRMCWHGY